MNPSRRALLRSFLALPVAARFAPFVPPTPTITWYVSGHTADGSPIVYSGLISGAIEVSEPRMPQLAYLPYLDEG